MSLYNKALETAERLLDEDQDATINMLRNEVAKLEKQLAPINDQIEKLNTRAKPMRLKLSDLKERLIKLNATTMN